MGRMMRSQVRMSHLTLRCELDVMDGLQQRTEPSDERLMWKMTTTVRMRSHRVFLSKGNGHHCCSCRADEWVALAFDGDA